VSRLAPPLLLALLALAAPAAASAHATLLRTTPGNGSVLARPPRVVIVVFDDQVRVGSGNVAVANTTNASVTARPATAHGRVLTIPLRTHLGDGDYSVRWSIVSQDGHREEGVLAFAVGAGSAAPHSVLTASVPLGWWTVAFRWLFDLGLLCAAGATVFGIRTRHLDGALHRPLSRLLFFSLLLAFIGCSAVVHAAPSGTRNALVLKVALLVALVGAAAAALAQRAVWLLPVAGGCSLALLLAPTLSGHALDRGQPWLLAVPADLAHLAAAAVWLGGLVALVAVVPRAQLAPGRRVAAARSVSRAALVAVVVLALAGVLRAVTELRSVEQLWTTGYGRALLVKTALFAPAVALGWLNRTRLLGLFDLLRRSVRVEVLLLAAVIAAVAVLVQLRPGAVAPRARAATAPLSAAPPPVLPPANTAVEAGELGALAVAVARADRTVTVTLLGPDGTGRSGRDVRVDDLPAAPCGAGCYRAAAPGGPLHVAVDGRALTFTVSPSAPPAAALLRRATRLYRASRTIVFDESLRSGPSGGILTRFELQAPDRLGYRIRGGAQAVVIGTRRWDRDTPTGRWLASQQTRLDVTQPYWREPTNVRLVAPRTLTFLDRSVPAWFRLTLGPDGRPKRLQMTAAAHFMVDRYARYDVPVELSPPSR
jgi:copper transport protein